MRASGVVIVLLAGAGLVSCGSTSPPATQAQTTTAAQRTTEGPGKRARPAGTGVKLTSIGRFDNPLYVTAPPGDARRVFVVEQTGRIRVVRGGKTLPAPFLDLSRQVVSGGEQGLLGLAFAPDYARTKRFYVYYTAAGTGADTLVEYRAASADRASASSRRVLFALRDPEPNHNGGQLAFGPDRLLYVGLGDGGSENDPHGQRGNGQSLGTLFGKILRIDPRAASGRPYRIPASNPFVGQPGARGEIYAYGLRNPWRFSFDRSNGDLSIGDVGQDNVEEVDFMANGRARGANFGWRPFEGTRRNYDEPAPGAVPPVLEKSHAQGWCSVTGGYVVRDPALPALRGQYVYGDYCEGRIRAAKLAPGGATGDRQLALPRVPSLTSFGEDARGRVYATSGAGPVYRLAPS